MGNFIIRVYVQSVQSEIDVVSKPYDCEDRLVVNFTQNNLSLVNGLVLLEEVSER